MRGLVAAPREDVEIDFEFVAESVDQCARREGLAIFDEGKLDVGDLKLTCHFLLGEVQGLSQLCATLPTFIIKLSLLNLVR